MQLPHQMHQMSTIGQLGLKTIEFKIGYVRQQISPCHMMTDTRQLRLFNCTKTSSTLFHHNDNTAPVPPDDTRQGSLNVQRPRLHPFNNTTLPLLHRPDHRHNTPCVYCLSCSCPCPAPRVYPLPARTSRRLRGGRRLAVTVTSLAGGCRGP